MYLLAISSHSSLLLPELEAELDVLLHREREQRVLLEDDAAVGAGALDGLAVHGDAAARGLLKPADDVEQRRLSAAGGAHDADELVLVNVKVHSVQGGHLALAGIELLDDVVDVNLYCCTVSCHPVNLLSR